MLGHTSYQSHFSHLQSYCLIDLQLELIGSYENVNVKMKQSPMAITPRNVYIQYMYKVMSLIT